MLLKKHFKCSLTGMFVSARLSCCLLPVLHIDKQQAPADGGTLMMDDVIDECTRVYFGNTPLVQPLRFDAQRRPVCVGCSETCFSPPLQARSALHGSQQASASSVCQCQGMAGGFGCLFANRFGSGGSEQKLSRIRGLLHQAQSVHTAHSTEDCLLDVCRISLTVFVSVAQITAEELLNLGGEKMDSARRVLQESEAPWDQRILELTQLMDHIYRIQNAFVFPQTVFNVARDFSGNALERCLLMVAMIRAFMPPTISVEARAVFSPPDNTNSHFSCTYVQFRRRGTVDGWQWASAYNFSTREPTRPPTTAQQSKFLLAIRETGLLQNATQASANTQSSYVYDEALVRRKLIAKNREIAVSQLFTKPAARSAVRDDLVAMMEEAKDDVTSGIRNSHRGMLNSAPDALLFADAVVQYNQAELEAKTVDNASLIPLRSYPGEVNAVRSFLLAFATPSQLDVYSTTTARACSLLRRCLTWWPAEGKSLLVFGYAQLLPVAAAHIKTEAALGILREVGVIARLSTTVSDNDDAKVQVALLRVVEVLFTVTEDHALLVHECSQPLCVFFGALTTALRSAPSPHHGEWVWSATRFSGELLYQASLTIQAVATSLCILSYSNCVDDSVSSLAVKIVTFLVSAMRASNLETLFFLREAASTVFADAVLDLLQPAARTMVSTTMTLISDECPIKYSIASRCTRMVDS